MNNFKNWVKENKFNIIASIIYFAFVASVFYLVD